MSRRPRRSPAAVEGGSPVASRGRVPASPRSPGRRWREWTTTAALSLAGAGALVVGPPRVSYAQPDEAEQLRTRLLEGDENTWPPLLAPLEKSSAQVGAVLGPVLRDRSAKAAPAGAYAAAWLVARAGRDGEILLGEDILSRAKDDVAWVESLRRALSGLEVAPAPERREPRGFPALLSFARTRFQKADQDPILGAEAAWLLRYTEDRDVVVELASAWDTGVGGVRAAAAEALEAALAYRFANAAAAHTFFSAHQADSFGQWVRRLSARKDAPESDIYRRLVREASANLSRVATLAELEPYLLSGETRWVEIRRLAARRAQNVEGTPEAWIALLQRVLEVEEDHETLATLLEQADRLPSAPRGGDDPFLRLVQERLRGCCTLAPSVAPSITKGLLRLLGKVGGPRDVELSFQALPATASPDVLDTLLTVAGQVGGVEQRLLEFHAARLPREGKADEADAIALRARALEALAHGGDRKPKPAAALAAAYLCEVLLGTDPKKREPAPAARRAAVRGLDGFPGPETAECLRVLVTLPGEDPGLARLAVSVLGRLATKDPTARTRLVEIGGLPTPSDARTEALKDLGGLVADAPEEARATVLPVLRAALRGTDPEARLAAASSLALWLDGESLTSLFDAVAEAYARSPGTSGVKETLEERDRPLFAALERLLEGLAKGEGADDEAIAMGVLRLGAAGAVEPALKLATLAATVGSGRIPLQTSRAELLRRRAAQVDREPEARRADLETGFKALKYAVKAAADAGERDGAWPRALLTTLSIAADLGDPSAATEALALAELARGVELNAVEKLELDRLLSVLRRGPPPPPR